MVSHGGFIAYYRVSTSKQGKSGLGIEAQRPALEKALAAARVRQVPLVVAKGDRLTRSVAFLSRLLEAGLRPTFLSQFPVSRFAQLLARCAED